MECYVHDLRCHHLTLAAVSRAFRVVQAFRPIDGWAIPGPPNYRLRKDSMDDPRSEQAMAHENDGKIQRAHYKAKHCKCAHQTMLVWRDVFVCIFWRVLHSILLVLQTIAYWNLLILNMGTWQEQISDTRGLLKDQAKALCLRLCVHGDVCIHDTTIEYKNKHNTKFDDCTFSSCM